MAVSGGDLVDNILGAENFKSNKSPNDALKDIIAQTKEKQSNNGFGDIPINSSPFGDIPIDSSPFGDIPTGNMDVLSQINSIQEKQEDEQLLHSIEQNVSTESIIQSNEEVKEFSCNGFSYEKTKQEIEDRKGKVNRLRFSIKDFEKKIGELEVSKSYIAEQLRKEDFDRVQLAMSNELADRTVRLREELKECERRIDEIPITESQRIASVTSDSFKDEVKDQLKAADDVMLKSERFQGVVDVAWSPRMRLEFYDLSEKSGFISASEDIEELLERADILDDNLDDYNRIKSFSLHNISRSAKESFLNKFDGQVSSSFVIGVSVIGILLSPILGLPILIFLIICFIGELTNSYKVKNLLLQIQDVFPTAMQAKHSADELVKNSVATAVRTIKKEMRNLAKQAYSIKDDIEKEISEVTGEVERKYSNMGTDGDLKERIELRWKEIDTQVQNYKDGKRNAELDFKELMREMKMLTDYLDDSLNLEIKKYYSYSPKSFKENLEFKGQEYLLPLKMPISTEEINGETIINYFEFPKRKALFVYNDKDEQEVIEFIKLLIAGLLMNIKPGSIDITIVDKKYNAEDFTAFNLDKNIPIRMTNKSDINVEGLRREFVDEQIRRTAKEGLKANGITAYNKECVESNNATTAYKFWFEFANEETVGAITGNRMGVTKFYLGMYQYYFYNVSSFKQNSLVEFKDYADDYYAYDSGSECFMRIDDRYLDRLIDIQYAEINKRNEAVEKRKKQ